MADILQFMLLANTAVARAIAFGLPEQSLLRRHEPPIERRIVRRLLHTERRADPRQDGFVTRAHKLGFEFEGTTAAALQKGFDNMPDPETALCLELLKKKAMQR